MENMTHNDSLYMSSKKIVMKELLNDLIIKCKNDYKNMETYVEDFCVKYDYKLIYELECSLDNVKEQLTEFVNGSIDSLDKGN